MSDPMTMGQQQMEQSKTVYETKTDMMQETKSIYDQSSKFRTFSGMPDEMTAEKRKREFQQKKTTIASMWLDKTSVNGDVELKPQTAKSTSKEFFKGYDLSILEKLLKNNDLGSGRGSFDDVMKKLNRYLASQGGGDVDGSAEAELRESISSYMKERRSAWTKKGKIQNAIIRQINDRFTPGVAPGA